MREVASLVLTGMRDPRLKGATLTEVSVSPDLKQARIFVSHYAGEIAAREAVKGLNGAAPRLRRDLAGRLALRVVPALVFAYDPSVDQGFRIDALLSQARREDRGGGSQS
jgi:ribosome-binding factor A